MAEKVDKSAAQRAAQEQAQRAQQISRTSRSLQQQGRMSIGQGATGSSFGQILQERMGTNESVRPQQLLDTQEEQKEERPQESRETRRGRETARRHGPQEKARESGERRSREDSDSREESRDSRQKDSGKHAKEAERRVVSKRGQREGKGSRQDRGMGQQAKGQQMATSKGEAKETRPVMTRALWAQTEGAGKSATATRSSSAYVPKTIPKHVLQQIVNYARLLVRPDGEKEMELALREEVFKGLRMRIATKQGKVQATFITSSKDVRDLFQNERHTLRKALTEKGLDVEGIDVIMT